MKAIIKRPSYKVRCYHCGCHFNFGLEDFHYVGDGKHSVICPNCTEIIPITNSNRELLGKVKVFYESNSN